MYSVSWHEVRDYISETVGKQLPGRLVDVMRVVVFGSVRAGTSRHSLRVRMFQARHSHKSFFCFFFGSGVRVSSRWN